MAQELAGKVAIITGGAAGIGRGTVELFVEEGAKVVIADVDEKNGTELADKLGSSARFVRTDVSKREDVQAVVDYAVSEFGGLHIMFNNAGISESNYAPLLDQTFDNFDKLMNINVFGIMLGTQIAGRHMAKNGGGSIINTSSIGGIQAGNGFLIYRSGKAAINLFTKCAAIELGPHLIRVNSICPGNIPTDMGSYTHPEAGMSMETYKKLREAILEVRMTRQPLKRQQYAVDIGQTALFLGSDRSQQMTGQVLILDGGATAGEAQSIINEILVARQRVLAEG